MKAIQINEFGGPNAMKYIDLSDPIAVENEVILDVTAIGINYSDTHKTENTYLFPQKLPMIPGIEVVGLYNGSRYFIRNIFSTICIFYKTMASCSFGYLYTYRYI
jgi:NADPH2:quinone reductase